MGSFLVDELESFLYPVAAALLVAVKIMSILARGVVPSLLCMPLMGTSGFSLAWQTLRARCSYAQRPKRSLAKQL